MPIFMQSCTMLELFQKYKLKTEDIIQHLFESLNGMPGYRESTLCQFEEYYFKVKPKLTSTQVRQILYGDLDLTVMIELPRNVQYRGLLLMVGSDQKQLVAVAAVTLLSKILDYQKNTHAE